MFKPGEIFKGKVRARFIVKPFVSIVGASTVELLGDGEGADHVTDRGRAIEDIAFVNKVGEISARVFLLRQNENQISLLVSDEISDANVFSDWIFRFTSAFALANALACSLKRSTTKKDQSAPNMAKTNPAIRLIVLAQRESKASIWLSVQGWMELRHVTRWPASQRLGRTTEFSGRKALVNRAAAHRGGLRPKNLEITSIGIST